MGRARFTVPEQLVRHIGAALGDAGHAWLARLPDAIEEACDRWELTPLDPFVDLTYAWVAPVRRRDGSVAVLKLGWPDEEARTGIAALRFFAGRGAVQPFEADPDRAWLLMERLEPGESLADRDDDSAARAFASVVGALHRHPPDEPRLPTLADWWRRAVDVWAEQPEPLRSRVPREEVEEGERLFAELASTTRSLALLHGDLHHRNVLSAGRAPWLAIDPKGVVGDPAFEPGAWLRNPMPELVGVPDLRERLRRRLDRVSAETGLDRRRVAGWGAVGSILSAIWSLTGGGIHLDHALDCARCLAAEVDATPG